MGLLNTLARQVKKQVGKAAGEALGNALLEQLGGGRAQAGQGAAPVQSPQPVNTPAPPKNIKVHFATILSEAFSAYQVQTLATAASLGFSAPASAKPYDFALIQGGQCKGVIMVTPHNRDNNAAFKNARAAAESAGVPFINFYAHFPNERSYVINRIHSYLG